MDQSLEEIIKAKRGFSRGRGGGRGRGVGGRGSRGSRGGGFRGGRGNSGSVAPVKSFKRQYAADVQGKWQHDMFSPTRGRGGGLTARRGAGAKLMISNLDYGVSSADIKELFSEFGQVAKSEVHYDKSGRSLGTASVVYSRPQDAQNAVQQYNNVPLDGRPMTIQVVANQNQAQQVNGGSSTDVKQRVDLPPQRQEGGVRGRGRGGRGRGQSRGRGRGAAKTPAPTADELDADLDAYRQAMES